MDIKINLKILDKLFSLFSGESLKAKAARGGVWLASGSVIDKILRLLRNIILTRILAPEAFGVIAIALSVNSFFETLTQVGIDKAIIQSTSGGDSKFQNGAWFFSLGRSIGLYLVAYFIAPYIANFYNNDQITQLLRVVCLSILFRGAISPRAYAALKNLVYSKWVFISHGGASLGIIISVVLVTKIQNEWILAIGFVLEAFFRMAFSFILCPYLPNPNFDRKALKELFAFARGMFGLPILLFIFNRVDIFVIGKLLPSKELGLYSMAIGLARMPLLFIATLLDELLMSVLSKVKNDNDKINQTLITVTKHISIFGIPSLLFIGISAEKILSLFYGEAYGKMAFPFTLVFLAEFIKLVGMPISLTYFALGKPGIHRFFTSIRALTIIVLIYPAVTLYQLDGAAVAIVASISVAFFFQLNKINKITGLRLIPYLQLFALPLLLCLLGGMLLVLVNKTILNSEWLSIGFGTLIVTAIITYLAMKSVKSNKQAL